MECGRSLWDLCGSVVVVAGRVGASAVHIVHGTQTEIVPQDSGLKRKATGTDGCDIRLAIEVIVERIVQLQKETRGWNVTINVTHYINQNLY